jgi:hypothetical protein
MKITMGDDTVEVSPAGGIQALGAGYEAKLTPAAGLHLANSGGDTVDIAPISSEVITLQETGMCESVAGVATPKKAYILRGASTDP